MKRSHINNVLLTSHGFQLLTASLKSSRTSISNPILHYLHSLDCFIIGFKYTHNHQRQQEDIAICTIVYLYARSTMSFLHEESKYQNIYLEEDEEEEEDRQQNVHLLLRIQYGSL